MSAFTRGSSGKSTGTATASTNAATRNCGSVHARGTWAATSNVSSHNAGKVPYVQGRKGLRSVASNSTVSQMIGPAPSRGARSARITVASTATSM